jgi:replicative DNA helicase
VDPLDRLPPHSHEAEQGVLGCCMLSPKECLAECVARFKSGSEVFYDMRHQIIFDAMVAQADRGEAVDLITLQQRLKDEKTLDQVGGIAYLSCLPDAVLSAANLSYYMEIVQEKFLLRRVVRVCSEAVARVYDYEGQVDTLLDEVERDVLAVRDGFGQGEDVAMVENVKQAVEVIDAMHARQGSTVGLATGLVDLDKLTGGLQDGQMWVVAARPSMGKTSLAMNIAENVAVVLNKPVAFFSGETTRTALTLRALCSMSRVNLRNVRDGFLAEKDFPKLTVAAGKLASAPMHILECYGWTVAQLRAKARRMCQRYGVRLVVFDYIQKFHATSDKGRRVENRQQEVAEISGGLSDLAKELKVPVLALAQLNRSPAKRSDGRPDLGDLRESGAIEQDADTVCLLWRPKSDQDDAKEEGDQVCVAVDLDVAKQKDGPVGTVKLTFLKSYTRFESAARICDADVPASRSEW